MRINVFVEIFVMLNILKFLKETDCLEKHLHVLLLLHTMFNAVFSRCEDVAKDQNTRDNSAWDCRERKSPYMRRVFHTGYLAHGNSMRVGQSTTASIQTVTLHCLT